MISGIVPNVQAALIGGLVMGALGCVTLTSAYRAVDWKTIILIVGMLPFSVALQRTGYFVALEKHESKLLEKTKEPALACTLEPYLPADDRTCAVCGCTCSIDFNDVMNQWVFTDAVRIHSKEIAHAECAAEEGLLEPRM